MEIITGIVAVLLGQKIAANLAEPGGWNFFNTSYMKIHHSMTAVIDAMIMGPRGIPGPLMLMSANSRLPAEGC
jgi:hypothetical protein